MALRGGIAAKLARNGCCGVHVHGREVFVLYGEFVDAVGFGSAEASWDQAFAVVRDEVKIM